MNKALRPREAGEVVGLTTRQVRRLIQRVRAEGAAGLVPRLRCTPSNRQYRPALKVRVFRLYVKHYRDVGPTLAAEKLAERHGIILRAETVCGWLRAAGVTHFQRRTRPHRAWRARKAHRGELVQLDGSYHDWFEGRGPQCVLMAEIHDASRQVFARFDAYEGTIPARDSFERSVRRYGVPPSVYTDKHTTYRALGEPTVVQQLAGKKPQRQFERALAELGMTVFMPILRRPGGAWSDCSSRCRIAWSKICAWRAAQRSKPPPHGVPSNRNGHLPGTASCCLPVTKPWRPR